MEEGVGQLYCLPVIPYSLYCFGAVHMTLVKSVLVHFRSGENVLVPFWVKNVLVHFWLRYWIGGMCVSLNRLDATIVFLYGQKICHNHD